MILELGPGSTVTGPVRIAGIADSVFEQTLLTRMVLDDGTTIAESFVTIQTPLPVFDGISHIASVEVILVP